MSFIKKGLKKAWKFVKKNWMVIALVAATVFTAGVASVGFAAFAGVSGPMSFMSAVGSTMWSGATAIAGTFGIGEGGFGAAAAGETVAAGEAVVGTAGVGVEAGTAANAAMMPGMTATSPSVVAGTTAADVAAASAAPVSTGMPGAAAPQAFSVAEAGSATIAPEAAADAAIKKGAEETSKNWLKKFAGDMTTEEAVRLGLAAAPVVGTALMAAGQPSQFRNVDYFGTTKDGPLGPGRSAFDIPDEASYATVGAGDPSQAGMGLMNMQQGRSQQSIMPGRPSISPYEMGGRT